MNGDVGMHVGIGWGVVFRVKGRSNENFECITGKLHDSCTRRTSKHIMHDKLFQLKQEGKRFDKFVMEIRKQGKNCLLIMIS